MHRRIIVVLVQTGYPPLVAGQAEELEDVLCDSISEASDRSTCRCTEVCKNIFGTESCVDVSCTRTERVR